jgi:hypothetical protein
MVRALTIPLTKNSPRSLRENALLEALLVHLRLLDDFFGSAKQTQKRQPKKDKDDVFARHWLPTSATSATQPPPHRWTQSGSSRIPRTGAAQNPAVISLSERARFPCKSDATEFTNPTGCVGAASEVL